MPSNRRSYDTWYDAAGRVTLRELGTNYTLGQTYTYYPWTQQGGRLQSLQSGLPADQDSLQSLSYSYDAGGNVLSIIDFKAGGTQTQTFSYDALDRLVSAVSSGGTGGTYSLQNYSYDTNGRLASNAGVSYAYDMLHIHAVASTSTGNTYSYDQNGNQTSRKVSGITYTLVYDAENRLVQIKRGSNIQATYSYDGDGNRVKTVVGSTTTTYVGNYLEWSGSTATMKKYYYAGGQRIAMRQGSTLYFLLTDHLGSTAVTATSGGGLYGEMRYYPWGGTRYSSGTTPTSYRYTGQREAEVGLYYYGARYYDPSIGRFISPDTIIPQQQGTQAWDRYAGMNNNPVRYKDPTGHCTYSEYCPWDDQSPMDYTLQFRHNNGDHGSLGTRISNTEFLTHNHFQEPKPVYVYEPGSSTRIGIAKWNEQGPMIGTNEQTQIGTTVSTMTGLSAPIASQETINRIDHNDSVDVVYWDDDNGQLAVTSLGVTSNNHDGTITLADPAQIINRGDSGGGIYYGGDLVGNTWKIITVAYWGLGTYTAIPYETDHTILVALVP